jgi:predicted acyltransferase
MADADAIASPRRRLPALDILRGIAVIGMILVNNPGSWERAPQQLQHAGWYGITFADTVAPAFLWAVGMAMELSFARRFGAEGLAAARWRVLGHVLRRAGLLFAVGVGLMLFAHLFPEPHWSALASISLVGILQRIALAYALAAGLRLTGRSPVALAAGLVVLYTALMFVGAGGFSGAVAFAHESNLATRLDARLLGAHASQVHALLTTLPAAGTVLLGAALGRSLRSGGEVLTARRFGGHVLLPLVLGAALATVLPVSRYLWTPSFLLITAGITAATFFALTIALRYLDADSRWWVPARAVGANPLLLFILSEMGRRPLEAFGAAVASGTGDPMRWRPAQEIGYDTLARAFPAGTASALYSLIYLAPFVALAVVLYRRRVFVKL